MRRTGGARCFKAYWGLLAIKKEREKHMGSIYTCITEETLREVSARMLDDIHDLTGGEADTAIALVKAYLEVESILDELVERQSETA